MHAGPKALIGILRLQIWIVNARRIAAKRFVGRRGLPESIWCDNATNFVGVQSQLDGFKKQLFSHQAFQDLQTFTSSTGVLFHFIPPRAPHFGGLWGAAVKSMKHLLIKNIGNSGLTYEELQTVAIEVEAVLNSRPMAPISEDPNDEEALTQSHFLLGSSIKALPKPCLQGRNPNILTRW
ncbi:uncharacterized protein LOC122320635 [Drosophila ficusphila]|uniref:uncharacterized protein LOC122320635 n=1 Tax=Drosophila ficusphila TaxID=30025 RepID=UPI001C8A49CD|nr:uncharacterized protein LOC122320635 [Drosophila ficusphila]